MRDQALMAGLLQAWRVVHPPRRGRWWLASRPLVHRGFYKTWAANGLNRQTPWP